MGAVAVFYMRRNAGIHTFTQILSRLAVEPSLSWCSLPETQKTDILLQDIWADAVEGEWTIEIFDT